MNAMWKTMSLSELLVRLGPCDGGRKWTMDYNTLGEAYDNCPDPYWILWIHDKLEIEISNIFLRFWGCDCIRLTPLRDGRKVWDLLDDIGRRTVSAAEHYACGELGEDDLHATLCYTLLHRLKSYATIDRLHDIVYPFDERSKCFALEATVDIVSPDKEIRKRAVNAANLAIKAAKASAWTNPEIQDAVEYLVEDACLIVQTQLLREFLGNPFR